MDESVGVRGLYLAVRWGGAGYISLMHRATDVVCLDGSVGVRVLYLVVRWGGAGYTSRVHSTTDVAGLLYLANEQLPVRVRPRLRAAS